MKFILVDGSSLLTTAFFGNVPRDFYQMKTAADKDAYLRRKALQTSNGVFTNAVYPMTRILLNLIEQQRPSHIAIAWDVSRNTFRKKLYNDYKGHREDALPILGEQYQTMQSLLHAMNIPQFRFEDYEADDIIGTLAKRFERDMPVYIITKDQDALQLITEHTRVWLMTSKAEELYKARGLQPKQLHVPDGTFEYTPVTFEEEYGLKPLQMIDKKALEGDSSDNIPGVKGVGEKAAIPLLQEFSSIEHLYNAIENMSQHEEDNMKNLMKSLGISRSPLSYLLKESDEELCGKKAAMLSKQLATICTDIEQLANLTVDDVLLDMNIASTREKFEELEFTSLLSRACVALPADEEIAG